jgi:DNA-binding Lrp family transcriptional regulator
MKKNPEKMELDRKLLELLKYGGVLAPKYVNISRKLGLPVSTVRDRVRKLEKRGVIRDYTAELDGTKIGYGVRVIRLVRFKAAFDKILDRYTAWGKAYPHRIRNIAWVVLTSGHYDAVFVYDFSSLEDYQQFKREISSLLGDFTDVEELTVTYTAMTEGKPERTLEELGKIIKQLIVEKPRETKSAGVADAPPKQPSKRHKPRATPTAGTSSS